MKLLRFVPNWSPGNFNVSPLIQNVAGVSALISEEAITSHANDSTKRDGAAAKLDGTDGQ